MKPLERPQSLTESAVRRLRDAIVAGDFGLGQPLSERQLAELLEVSKTPVREALAQLRIEGLVRIVPQRGASVFTLSQPEVIEICELRQALEACALAAAMERNRKPLAADLDQCVRRMAKARSKGDIRAYLLEDTAFHRYFFAHCGNTLMEHHYDMVVGKIAALRTHLAHRPNHTDLSFAEHERMAELANANNSAAMLAILEVHINRTKESYAAGVTDIAAADRASEQISKRKADAA